MGDSMRKEKRLFTSESVSEGHPDKVADQISDAILDAILAKDPNGRVACETTVTTGLVLVVGEISTSAYVDIQSVVLNWVLMVIIVPFWLILMNNRVILLAVLMNL